MSDGRYTITLDHERRLVHVTAQGEFDIDRGERLASSKQDARLCKLL